MPKSTDLYHATTVLVTAKLHIQATLQTSARVSSCGLAISGLDTTNKTHAPCTNDWKMRLRWQVIYAAFSLRFVTS